MASGTLTGFSKISSTIEKSLPSIRYIQNMQICVVNLPDLEITFPYECVDKHINPKVSSFSIMNGMKRCIQNREASADFIDVVMYK